MSNVVKLRQPIRKRLRGWWKFSREDRLGWMAVVMVVVALIQDMRGYTDKATFILGLAIMLMLLANRSNNK